jgi:hypothetical protein
VQVLGNGSLTLHLSSDNQIGGGDHRHSQCETHKEMEQNYEKAVVLSNSIAGHSL